MESLQVIKIGGKVIADDELLDEFLNDFSELEGHKILVHGGGNIASQFSERMGVDVKMVRGRRVTDEDSLEVAVMTYAGLINKKLVAQLQSRGCNALGLSGADLNAIKAFKRRDSDIDYGFVGDVDDDSVNVEGLTQLLNMNISPVFCALTHDGNGQLFNTNADTLAAVLAHSLSENFEVTLTFCFEKQGVLEDVEDDSSVIPEIDRELYAELKQDGTIHEGMLPKMENAFTALSKGVRQVSITHPANLLTKTGTILK
ncbi:acetylglutamate kinase [Aliifodinibius sp. S!AR15-10]|uniref:acetylglutamate kinase n=1 Tax=Aliifodinibius sp. S!AR15-10 TaxID=2950437 RepID=UPI002860CBD4|nr:acetylglutamate kinase [Aliifodinibius sp. S!AR15-10]MDR8392185.1 acetylglutamate kinase [Aliifodinibius sp. S!AR15-10]